VSNDEYGRTSLAHSLTSVSVTVGQACPLPPKFGVLLLMS